MAGVNPRQRLLDAAIEHIAERGISDLSLRELAAAIGSSHRMLIHHFGGREGLLVAVVQAVEERQRALVESVVALDAAASPGDAMRAWWKHISHEALWANERLFFELYGQALQGRPGTVALLDGIIDAWLEPAATMLRELGLEDGTAGARLGIAVTRGLLLDLLATGEVEQVDAAMDVHIAAMEALMSLRADRGR